MSKRITKTKLREFIHNLRISGMDACMKATDVRENFEPSKWASLRERGELSRKIANELDAILDGELNE